MPNINHEEENNGFINVLLNLLKGAASFIVDSIKNTHKEGHIFILIASLVTFIGYLISSCIGTVFLIITAWVVYFFRDPHRIVPNQKGILVSPADGTITKISQGEFLPEELGHNTQTKFTMVSIFLNVFNVHVNRIPIKGIIEKKEYIEGKFFNASLDKSSKENERNILLIKTDSGELFGLVQIAGLIARRIVCYAKEGDSYETGERYGIIRFGSRVDIYIPEGYMVNVQEGQTMIGGETIIAIKSARIANFG